MPTEQTDHNTVKIGEKNPTTYATAILNRFGKGIRDVFVVARDSSGSKFLPLQCSKCNHIEKIRVTSSNISNAVHAVEMLKRIHPAVEIVNTTLSTEEFPGKNPKTGENYIRRASAIKIVVRVKTE